MTEGNRKNPLTAPYVRAAVSLGLVLLVVASIDTQEVRQTLTRVSVITILALTLFDIVLRLFSALRWHLLVTALTERPSVADTARITFVSSFLGQALPGVVGVEALRVYKMTKETGDSASAVASVVADKIFGLASLAVAIVIGILIGPDSIQDQILLPFAVVTVCIAAFTAILVVPAARPLTIRIIPTRIRGKIEDWIERVYDCFDHYRTRPALLIVSLLLATAFQFGRIFLFFAAALLIGEAPDLIYFVSIVPVVMFAALLPISIAGLGVREASLVFFFSQFGVMSSASAFTVSILVFLSGLLSTLPGVWFYTRDRKSLDEVVHP